MLLISWHPLSRLTPNAAGDSFPLVDDADTHDDAPTLSEEDIREARRIDELRRNTEDLMREE